MIKVLFFASVREAAGVAEMELNWDSGTVAEVQSLLEKQFNQVLAEKLLFAVNQEMVDADHLVTDGDEVGFFPPVTGG